MPFLFVNAGAEGFMRAAALELPRGIRVNVVSPPWDIETLMALKMDPSLCMPAAQVARAYLPSMEGTRHGTDHRSPQACCEIRQAHQEQIPRAQTSRLKKTPDPFVFPFFTENPLHLTLGGDASASETPNAT